jgi:hypothetical protein
MVEVLVKAMNSPVFIGVRPKARRMRPPDWCKDPKTEHVAEICSVSNCIAVGPTIWLGQFAQGIHWTDEERIAAWTLVDAERKAMLLALNIPDSYDEYPSDQFCLCAFRVFPWIFAQDSAPTALEPPQLFADDYALPLKEPDWTKFERLGYDAVQFKPTRLLDLDGLSRAKDSTLTSSYGCSPLSCNGLACLYPVNRYCLLDNIETAFEAATTFGRDEPEPGPYVVVEVLRSR